MTDKALHTSVIAGLDPAIHAVTLQHTRTTRLPQHVHMDSPIKSGNNEIKVLHQVHRLSEKNDD